MMRRVTVAILILLVPQALTACAPLQEPPVQTAPPQGLFLAKVFY